MSTVTDQETQDFIELLYERSGRTNGLYTGLYQEWAKLTLQAQRTAQLDAHLGRRRDTGTPGYLESSAKAKAQTGRATRAWMGRKKTRKKR